MGHGQKNTNRGEAINRNAARIERLAKKIAEIKKEMTKDFEDLGEEVMDIDVRTAHKLSKVMSAVVTHEIRLRGLERPWWKKLFRIKPEISVTLQAASEVDAPKLDEDETEVDVAKEEKKAKPGHHVLNIKNSRLGTKSPIIGEKKEEEKKPGAPPTPSHRQVVVDPKKPGPKKGG